MKLQVLGLQKQSRISASGAEKFGMDEPWYQQTGERQLGVSFLFLFKGCPGYNAVVYPEVRPSLTLVLSSAQNRSMVNAPSVRGDAHVETEESETRRKLLGHPPPVHMLPQGPCAACSPFCLDTCHSSTDLTRSTSREPLLTAHQPDRPASAVT